MQSWLDDQDIGAGGDASNMALQRGVSWLQWDHRCFLLPHQHRALPCPVLPSETREEEQQQHECPLPPLLPVCVLQLSKLYLSLLPPPHLRASSGLQLC